MEFEEPKTKEQELADLQEDVQRMKVLIQHPGWKLICNAFATEIDLKRNEILNNATRLEMKGKALDGMQAMQIEAMEKGQIKGLMALLNFPEIFIAQGSETINLLKKTLAMKEEEDGTE